MAFCGTHYSRPRPSKTRSSLSLTARTITFISGRTTNGIRLQVRVAAEVPFFRSTPRPEPSCSRRRISRTQPTNGASPTPISSSFLILRERTVATRPDATLPFSDITTNDVSTAQSTASHRKLRTTPQNILMAPERGARLQGVVEGAAVPKPTVQRRTLPEPPRALLRFPTGFPVHLPVSD